MIDQGFIPDTLKEFTEWIFRDSKKPEDFPGVKKLEKLVDIPDDSTILFVNRGDSSVSAYEIGRFFRMNDEMIGMVEGKLEIGNYLSGEYFVAGGSEVTSWTRDAITQENLNEIESYIYYVHND